MTHKSMLCVGGPLSGRRFEAERGTGFTVPVAKPETTSDPEAEDYRPNATVEYVNHHYKAETFHTPQGDVEFYSPHTQTPLESITILLDGFEKSSRPGSDKIDKAAASVADLVDEFTQRGWNDAGRASFAKIIKRRLSRFWSL